ncbi:MAG: OadG family protein [Candidatus Marinimicrobia bacterium]|nr:OadG family protein [Candidatus Neomarinimicrobiota bacterium]
MKQKLSTAMVMLLPVVMTAGTGIPEENRQLVYSLSVLGILIVLFALLVVALSVAVMSKTIYYSAERRRKRRSSKKRISGTDDETAAAIATALHLYKRSHEEEEKAIITIRKVIKPLSGWNNKAFGMRKPGTL